MLNKIKYFFNTVFYCLVNFKSVFIYGFLGHYLAIRKIKLVINKPRSNNCKDNKLFHICHSFPYIVLGYLNKVDTFIVYSWLSGQVTGVTLRTKFCIEDRTRIFVLETTENDEWIYFYNDYESLINTIQYMFVDCPHRSLEEAKEEYESKQIV